MNVEWYELIEQIRLSNYSNRNQRSNLIEHSQFWKISRSSISSTNRTLIVRLGSIKFDQFDYKIGSISWNDRVWFGNQHLSFNLSLIEFDNSIKKIRSVEFGWTLSPGNFNLKHGRENWALKQISEYDKIILKLV